jgi:hypothetical protein
MKKYVFTESQVKKIIDHLIKEEEESEAGDCGRPGMPTLKGLFKNCEIEDADQNKFKKLLNSPNCKFQVKSVDGGIKLNGKWAQKGMILTPDTSIEICNMSTYLMLSGMGYPEAYVTWGQDAPAFGSQHA